MLVHLTMKTPDVVDYCVKEEFPESYQEDERDELTALLERWFSYGECLTVEVDTVRKTCKVLPI